MKETYTILSKKEAVRMSQDEMGISSGPTAKQRLLDLGKLNEGKANEYGPFERLGEILATMFPVGVTLNNAADFNRFALLVQIVNKLNRNAQYMPMQVHPDSLDDIAVLSMMLQSFHADGHT